MIKIWICDDDPAMVDTLLARCRGCPSLQNIQVGIRGMTKFPDLLSDGKGTQVAVKEEDLPDILLLDIDMPGMDGLEIKDSLAKLRTGPYIIFVTSHVETIEEAFGRNVIGFLRKPVEDRKLDKLMEKAIGHYRNSQQHVVIDGRRLLCQDIQYLHTVNIYTEVILQGSDRLEVRKSMKEWEKLLPAEEFFRTNESYIVNLTWVKKVEGDRAFLEDGTEIPISRRKKTQCREAFFLHAARNVRYR